MQKSSKSKRNDKINQNLLPLGSLFISIFLTLYLSTKANMLTDNFTYLANQTTTQGLFFIWAFVSIVTHYYLLYSLFHSLNINKLTLLTTFSIMLISSLIPYEKGVSFLGFLHVATAYIAFILYNYSLFKIYTNLKLLNQPHIDIIFGSYLMMLGVCFSITMYYGSINGLVEVLFCIITPILLNIIKIKAA